MEEDYREFEAKTVDEAIILAMKSYHAAFEDLEIKVVSEGSKGIFGLVGTKSAKIMARRIQAGEKPLAPVREEPVLSQGVAEPKEESRGTDRRGEPRTVEPSRKVLESSRETLCEMLRLMSLPGEVRIREDGVLEIIGDGSGLIIGKRGATLDALQFILNRVVNKPGGEPVYITLDTEGYRQRHVNHLKSMALKMGQRAKRTGQAVSLEKMNPYDRRIIHLALKDDSSVNTKSIGEGIYKKVLIVPRKSSR